MGGVPTTIDLKTSLWDPLFKLMEGTSTNTEYGIHACDVLVSTMFNSKDFEDFGILSN